jgi:plastocyanin
MRSTLLATVTLACGLLSGCPSDGESGVDMALPRDLAPPDMAGCPSNKPPAATITVKDDYYEPKEVTIPVCGKVRWNFQAGGTHGVFPWDMGFPESPVQASGTFEHVFPKAGVFEYGCAIHGRNMPGKITVQ